MSYSLFDAIQSLHNKLETENLDIHSTVKEMSSILSMSRHNSKLRIITQFISILYALVMNYKYDDTQKTTQIKELVKQSLVLIQAMGTGRLLHTTGALHIDTLSQKSRILLVDKLGDNPFLYDPILFENFAIDLEKDLISMQQIYLHLSIEQEDNQYKMFIYYLCRCSNSVIFLGIENLQMLLEGIQQFTDLEYQYGRFSSIGSNTEFLSAYDYFFRRLIFIKAHFSDRQQIVRHFSEYPSKKVVESLLNGHTDTMTSKGSLLIESPIMLSSEEIGALMGDGEFDMISFDDVDLIEDEKIERIDHDKLKYLETDAQSYLKTKYDMQQLHHMEYKYEQSYFGMHEDYLIRLLGRLFQKQEQIENLLSPATKSMAQDDLQEIEKLTNNIKEMIFHNYYVNIAALVGEELRFFIQQETKNLDKKIRLGIRGEQSEVLTRQSQFIKNLILTLVKNSLHYSLESTARRKALEKSETGWLLIEFEDTGDSFDIYVRDDGKGVDMDRMNISEIEEQVREQGGILEIDSLEQEYLKVHIQVPMKKMISECMVISLGDVYVLIPNRCIEKVLSLKEVSTETKDEHYLGKISLSMVLGINKSPINLFLVCKFGEEKIFFGVDQVLYKMEALIETVNTPLIPCAKGVVILKDGSLGFILNEKILYQTSYDIIKKRSGVILEKVLS